MFDNSLDDELVKLFEFNDLKKHLGLAQALSHPDVLNGFIDYLYDVGYKAPSVRQYLDSLKRYLTVFILNMPPISNNNIWLSYPLEKIK